MSRMFNVQYAVPGAAMMGGYVAAGNLTAGWEAAARAGALQACLSLIVVGVNTAIFLRLLLALGQRQAIVGSTLIAVSVAFLVHLIGHTPNLLITILIVAGAAATQFSLLATVHRRFGTIQPIDLFALWRWRRMP